MKKLLFLLLVKIHLIAFNQDCDLYALKADMDNHPEFSALIQEKPELIEAWKRYYDLGEDVIPAGLRTNGNFLTKFDDLSKNNNLGLGATDIENILKAPSLKTGSNGLPMKWDDPEAVLDAIKRTSDSGTSGVTISHKKFPTPSEGNESFVLKNAKQYQAEASGDAGLSFDKNGVSFDNVASDGTLIDRKYGHGGSIFNEVDDGLGGATIEIHNNSRVQSILDQAQRQVDAAGGSHIKWEVSTELGAKGIRYVFDNLTTSQLIKNIEVVYVPQVTIIP
ncbi:MAG: hypothetical protein IPM74_04030 [Crocinitomicaceae bacterium]|nr:hypothetical protein [Crocinitomicaceae bacterium]MBK8925076.1 hypothetical protein [Crocinitomicaceae bacterium]